MKAILLAAGRGERFYPFDHYRAKPMFPVANRPLLERLLERMVAAGISDIGIVVAWQDGSIRSHFADGTRFGCQITYINQPEPAGTADAVVCARDFIGESSFLAILGDLYLPDSVLPEVCSAYAESEHGVAATLEVTNISEHSSVSVDTDGRLRDYVWKPRGRRGLSLPGVYALPASAVDDLANVTNVVHAQFGIAPQEGKEIEAVIPTRYREGRALREIRVDGPILDLDYPWQPHTFAIQIARELGNQHSDSKISETAAIDPGAHIEGPVIVGDHSVIGRNACIKGPAWIGSHTHIVEGSQIDDHTMIGDHCRIGPYANVSGFVGNDCRITYLGEFNGTMLDGGRVTHQIQLSGVFGLGAEIGAGTQCGTLRFDDGPIEVEVKGQRRVAEHFSGVLFGDYARTGVGAMMMPGRIVGRCSMVGAGVVLMNNVPPHKALLLKQETNLIDWSPEIYNR